MDRQTEQRWRAALQERGKDRVQAELELRPGGAEDLIYGLTDSPPYPTRGFCEAWVRGKPPPSFGLSGNTAVLIGFSLLAVACIAGAVGGLTRGGPGQGRPAFSGGFAPPPAAPTGARTAAPAGGANVAAGGGFLPPRAGLELGQRDGSAPSLMPDCTAVTKSDSVHSVASARPCKPAPLPSALNAGSPAQGGLSPSGGASR